MKYFRSLTIAAAFSFASVASYAAVVASNPWDSAATDAGAFSQANQRLATQFTLSAATGLNAASWRGTMFSSDPLNTGDTWGFSVNIFANGAVPGSLLGTANVVADVTDTGLDIAGERTYEFDAAFASVALGAGDYWLSILNTDTQNTFRWTRGTGGTASAVNGGPLNEPARTHMNFTLFGETGQQVPEPNTLALAALSLGLLALRRRRV